MIQVRPARVEDADALAEVHVRSWQAAYGHVFGAERLAAIDVEPRRVQWRRRLAEPESRAAHFAAEDGSGRVVAFATCGESRERADEGELYAIYALREAWGSGAAAELMAAVLGHLAGEGFADAVLWVLDDNPRARRFYEREGWAPDGARREEAFLGVEVAEVRYRIRLS